MSQDLASMIGASATWLCRAYGPPSPFLAVLADVQVRQAVTTAAWLRYPTDVDAALMGLVGPGGAATLDALSAGPAEPAESAEPWHSWVDEVVVSWAACLMLEPDLARASIEAAATTDHVRGLSLCLRRLVEPDSLDTRATVLLRHPDLIGPIARLHRAELVARLEG